MSSIISFFTTLASALYLHLGLAVANLPSYFSTTQIIHNVPYGSNPSQTMDIYVPKYAERRKLDVVVFFYGGRWTFGKKEDYRFIGNTFASADFITVIFDYQKYPKVRFPIFIEDAAKALAWVHDNIGKYHGDNTRINIVGHSAGAHIGALVTTNPAYLKHEGKTPAQVIHRFAGLAGPYSFTPDEPDLEAIFAPPANYPNMRASTFVTGKEPPMLLMWGDADTDVGAFNLEQMDSALRMKRGTVKSIIYPGLDHIGIIRALTWMFKDKTSVFLDTINFFRQ
ncbi:MAG: alpha/beta hydrolase [Alphaproteobacteria bacterium]|nr:alpha/beta hydrolase [Alphaproteobacteria bacterium]